MVITMTRVGRSGRKNIADSKTAMMIRKKNAIAAHEVVFHARKPHRFLIYKSARWPYALYQ